MNRPLHIGIVSVLFDRKPEGICTGRLVRALLDAGHRVTLWTSSKADLAYRHDRLEILVAPSGVRSPRWLFKLAARLTGTISSNFYLWTRRIVHLSPSGESPDVIYGRAWPHASLVAAEMLSRRLARPLLLHLSDPFPQPPDTRVDPDFMAGMQKLIDRSHAITFTNHETIEYQRRFLDFSSERALVLNHVAPSAAVLGPPNESLVFCHIGTLRADRPAEPLLDGFAVFLRRQPQARLVFVGNVEDYLRPLIAERGLAHAVSVFPFTNDVKKVMSMAGVLVTVDAMVANPVFTPTKVVEYLQCDRTIMALTPSGSPVAKLLEGFTDSAIVVDDYSAEAVADGFAAAAALPYRAESFAARHAAMIDFSPGAIAATFAALAESAIVGSIRD